MAVVQSNLRCFWNPVQHKVLWDARTGAKKKWNKDITRTLVFENGQCALSTAPATVTWVHMWAGHSTSLHTQPCTHARTRLHRQCRDVSWLRWEEQSELKMHSVPVRGTQSLRQTKIPPTLQCFRNVNIWTNWLHSWLIEYNTIKIEVKLVKRMRFNKI